MFVEMRQYRFHPGLMAEFIELYLTQGFAIQRRFLGEPIGYYTSEIGELNQVVHLWRYDSYEDRARRRAAMNGDPDWQAYLTKILPLIKEQRSTILNPVELPV